MAGLERFGGPYGAAQTALLVAYAGIYFLSPAPGRGLHPMAGALPCAAGLVLLVASFASLGKAVQVSPEPRAGATLVTRGVYTRLRHPMYTAIVLVVIGLFLRRATPAVGVLTLVVIVFLGLKVRQEERLLARRYPDYAAYRARTWGVFLTPPR